MKVSAILIPAIQAAPSRLSDEMLRVIDMKVADWLTVWLTLADETFNFASDNLEQFSAAADEVSLIQTV